MAAKTTTGKRSSCKCCTEEIASGVDCIGCEGFCNDVFHAACVKLSHEDLVQYHQVSNFWWLCNDCIDRIRKQRQSHRSIPAKELDVKTDASNANEIDRIDGEIAVLKAQISTIHSSLLNATVSRIEPTVAEDRPVAESSLLLPPDCQQGRTTADCRSSIIEERSTNDRFWLFFTRVKNRVTEQQISKLVTDSLGTEDVVVRKLVPAWKDPLLLPYVSFKVGINVRLKQIALSSSTWPTGLCYREFRDYVWEPL